MKKTALLLSLLLFALPAAAQHGRTGYSGFSLVTPARLSIGADSGFLVERTLPAEKLFLLSLPPSVLQGVPDFRPKPQSDRTLLLDAPTLAFLSDTRRRELSVTYQPEFEIFERNSDQNSMNHNAALSFTYLKSRRVQFFISDLYRSSNDPSRTLQNVFLLLPRSRYQENSLRGGVTFEKSPVMSFSLRYENTVSTFGQKDVFQARTLDAMTQGVSFMATRMMSQRQRLRVTYSAFIASPLNHESEADEVVDTGYRHGFSKPAHSITGEYRFTLSPSTVMELSGGGVRTDHGLNYVFGVSGDKRFGNVWLGGGYSRSLSFLSGGSAAALPTGLSSDSFYEIVQLRMRGQPFRDVGIALTVSGSRGVYGALLGETRSLLGSGRVDYRLTDRTVTFVSAERYQQNQNDYVGAALARNRIFGGIEFSFASDMQRRTSRLNRDADNVGLTAQDRRTQRPD